MTCLRDRRFYRGDRDRAAFPARSAQFLEAGCFSAPCSFGRLPAHDQADEDGAGEDDESGE